MMPGDSIPRADDVVRYVGGSLVDDYGIDGAAFELRERDMRQPEPGLSCNWLAYFAGLSKCDQVDQVRSVIHLTPGSEGVFGELNVGVVLDAIRDRVPHARFAYKPQPPEGRFPADDSHCELLGLPDPGSHEAELLGDRIAALVERTYPAVRS